MEVVGTRAKLALPERHCGPGGLQATRVSLVRVSEHSEGGATARAALGVRRKVLIADATLPAPAALGEKPANGVKNRVPVTVQDVSCRQLGPELPHDVQSVTCSRGGRTWVAAVDAAGTGFATRLDDKALEEKSEDERAKRSKASHAAQWQGEGCLTGWSGVAFLEAGDSEPTRVVSTSNSGSRWIDLETGSVVAQVHHAQTPLALCAAGPSMAIVAEWGGLSLWDLRAKDAVSAVRPGNRVLPDRAPIYALDADADDLAVAGESRVVLLLDVRTWKQRRSWKAPVKYDAVGVKLLPDTLVVAGLDHELVAAPRAAPTEGKHKAKRMAAEAAREGTATPQSVPIGSMLHQNYRTFRSEAPWAGVDVLPSGKSERTVFVGLANTGVLYGGLAGPPPAAP